MINERKTYIVAAFYYGLIFGGRKCLHATSQKCALSHAISLAVNYRLFSHSDVSYRFNGKNDNVVLELTLSLCRKYAIRDKTEFIFVFRSHTQCPSMSQGLHAKTSTLHGPERLC